MDLKPLAVASCCVLALSFAACQDMAPMLVEKPKEEAPWKRNILAAKIQPSEAGQPPTAELSQLLERAGAVPGVKTVEAVDILPGVTPFRQKTPYVIQQEGRPIDLTDGLLRGVSLGYFRAMEIRLLQGREFSAMDGEHFVPVAIVGESYAKKIWPRQSAIGQRMSLHKTGPWATVVGVVQDGPGAQGTPELYFPLAQYALHGQDVQSRPWFVIAHVTGDPKDVAPALSRAVGRDFQDLGTWLKKL
ncbi:MAG: ABC transporter permease [Thermoanaerobaculia bacterium]